MIEAGVQPISEEKRLGGKFTGMNLRLYRHTFAIVPG